MEIWELEVTIRLIVNDTLVISGNVNAAGGIINFIVNDGGVLNNIR